MTKKSKQLFMGVDIGISSIKAAVFDPDGNQLGFHKIEISLIYNLTGMADTRAKNQADFIKEKFDYKKMSFNTGCRVIHPIYPLSKILWLKETESYIYKKVYERFNELNSLFNNEP